MKKFLKHYWPILVILLFGLCIRLYNFTAVSLWHDEAFSALLIKYSFSEMIYRIGLDVHPPMYYIFLRFWSIPFGDSLASLRGFSTFFGAATIPASYALVNTIFKNNKLALLVAGLIAINPFQVQYVSEARMYTMGAFFAVLGTYVLVKALNVETKAKRNTKVLYYLLFAICCGVMILTHYYLLFTAAALCAYALLYTAYTHRLKYKEYGSLILAYIFIGISFLPYLSTFLYQYRQVGGNYWIPPIDRWSIPTTLWQMFAGIGVDIAKSRTQILVTLVTIFSLIVIIKLVRKFKEQHKWLILFAFFAPFAGSLLFALLSAIKGQSSSVYLVRYFLYASTFYTIIVSCWFISFKSKKTTITLSSLYIILSLFGVYHYWDEVKPKERPGMQAAAKYLKANVSPVDKLYIGSSFEFFNFKYYNSRLGTSTGVRPLLFSGGNTEVKNMPHYAGTAILTNEDLLPDFSAATKPGDTVWLLWTNGFGGSKPETPKDFKQIGDEKVYPEIRPYIGTNIYITQYKVN